MFLIGGSQMAYKDRCYRYWINILESVSIGNIVSVYHYKLSFLDIVDS